MVTFQNSTIVNTECNLLAFSKKKNRNKIQNSSLAYRFKQIDNLWIFAYEWDVHSVLVFLNGHFTGISKLLAAVTWEYMEEYIEYCIDKKYSTDRSECVMKFVTFSIFAVNNKSIGIQLGTTHWKKKKKVRFIFGYMFELNISRHIGS